MKGLSNCPRLQRIFLSNNRIDKFDNIASLSDASQLQELALDGNQVAHGKNYTEFCLSSCPLLKHLDLKKVTPEMRESIAKNVAVPKKSDDPSQIGSISPDKNDSQRNGASIGSASTEVTPDKAEGAANDGSKVQGSGGSTNLTADDLTPEGLLEVISQEWKNELERLRARGFNGYRRRKESRNECLVQSGHAEIEGDSMLFIYGNAMEVLTNPDFQKTVQQICFQYMRFDNIVSHSNMNKLKKF